MAGVEAQGLLSSPAPGRPGPEPLLTCGFNHCIYLPRCHGPGKMTTSVFLSKQCNIKSGKAASSSAGQT